MPRFLTWVPGLGTGDPSREIVFASVIRLLQRGGPCEIVGLSADPRQSELDHPGVAFADARDATGVQRVLPDADRLLLAGDLGRDADVERAADLLVHAKLSGIPVALVAVHLRGPHPALELLASAESISVADAVSARILTPWARTGVTTTAPLELLLAPSPAPDPCDIVVHEAAFERLPAGERPRALETLASRLQPATLGILAGHRGAVAPWRLPAAVRWVEADSWSTWAASLAGPKLVLAPSGHRALVAATGAGAFPVAVCDADTGEDFNRRLGLDALRIPCTAGIDRWLDTLRRAREIGADALATRVEALRCVAWRALGVLAAPGKSCRSLHEGTWSPRARRRIAERLADSCRALLDRGDAQACWERLMRWQGVLAREPRWVELEAQCLVLQGQDRAARQRLESTLIDHPRDPRCAALLASVCFRLGDAEAAQACLRRVALLDPHASDAWHQLGCLAWLRGDAQEALRVWQHAVTHLGDARSARALRDLRTGGSPAAPHDVPTTGAPANRPQREAVAAARPATNLAPSASVLHPAGRPGDQDAQAARSATPAANRSGPPS